MKANVTHWTVLAYTPSKKPAALPPLPRALRRNHFDAEALIFAVTMLAVTAGGICAFFWMFQ